jgi:hypothetical protein
LIESALSIKKDKPIIAKVKINVTFLLLLLTWQSRYSDGKFGRPIIHIISMANRNCSGDK